MANPQLDHHRRNNLATAGAFETFRSHRERVTAELISCTGASLAVWGAGNCNDLDLARLRERFDRIVLYDIDLRSMTAGVAKQLPNGDRRIETIEADAVWWGTNDSAEAESFDVVASVGLLSQILHFTQIHDDDREDDAVWNEIERLRSEHLTLLMQTTRPEGTALLFNDFLSTDTCPSLATCGETDLPALIRTELSRQNFFTGMNPAAIERTIRTEPSLAAGFARTAVSLPWRWELGASRVYAVCVHRLVRQA